MWTIVTDRVAWSLCLSVIIVHKQLNWSRCRLGYELRTWVGPRNRVLDGVHIPHMKRQFGGQKWRLNIKYRDALPWAVEKWLNRSRCSLWYWVRCVQGAILDGVHFGATWQIWLKSNRLYVLALHRYIKLLTYRTFSAAGSRLWNSLPRDVTECQTLAAFRRKLKHFLFSLSIVFCFSHVDLEVFT